MLKTHVEYRVGHPLLPQKAGRSDPMGSVFFEPVHGRLAFKRKRRAPLKVVFRLEQGPGLRNTEAVKVSVWRTMMLQSDGFGDCQGGSSVGFCGEGLRASEEALTIKCRGETCQEIGGERLEKK